MACIKSHPARCLTSWLNQTSYDTAWFEGCQRTSRLPTGKDRGVITIEGHGLVWTVVVAHHPVVRTTRSYPASLSLRMNHSHCGQILSGLVTAVTLLLIISDVKSEEARICVTTEGFLLRPAINCTSGYMINVTGAEFWNLSSSHCGVNVCPCDHENCRVNVDRVEDSGSRYNSIISHCQYKQQCGTVTLPRTETSPCRGADLLLINYTCIDEPSFPDTPTTSSQITGTSGSPAAPTTSGSSSQDNAGSDSTDPGTTSTGTNGMTETPTDHPPHTIAIAAGASAGAVVIIIVIVVAVICVKRRQATPPKGVNDYQNDRTGGGHPKALVMGPVATVEPYSETIVGRPDGPPGGPPAAEYSYAAVPDRLADMPREDGVGDDSQDKDPTYSLAGTLGDNRRTVATPTGAQKAAVPDVYSQVKLREPRLSKREVVSDNLDVTENAIYGAPLT